MAFNTSGTLVTDQREIAISDSWETQTDWEAYQSKNNIDISNGTLSLTEFLFIENFEDGNVSEYSTYNSSFDVTTDTIFGEYSGVLTNQTGGNSHAVSTTGLNSYPQAGDSFSFRVKFNSIGLNFAFGFAIQSNSDNPSGYYVHFSTDNNNITLWDGIELNGGSEIVSDNQTYNSDVWYEVIVNWDSNGDITVELRNESGDVLNTINGTDTTYTNGGISYSFAFGGTGGGTKVNIDEVEK